MDFSELKELTDFSQQLTIDDILDFKLQLNLPEALFQTSGNVSFLFALKKWAGHNPFKFYQSLQQIRPDLVLTAIKIPWLCKTSESEVTTDSQLSMRSLIELLKTELTVDKQMLIHMTLSTEMEENVDIEITLNKLFEGGYIKRDLSELSKVLVGIQREDLVNKLKPYQTLFYQMDEEEFYYKFRRAMENLVKEIETWVKSLKQFIYVQNKQVKQMLGKDDAVNLADVFVELTILKQPPREVDYNDETTYNEIAYLRRISKRKTEIETVDFTEELLTYKQSVPEIWCIIGNPGCGKTFLSKKIALMFGKNELTHISYSIAMP